MNLKKNKNNKLKTMEKNKENKKEINSEAISKVIQGMVDIFHKEESDFYKTLIGNVSPKEIETPEDFFHKVIRPAEKYWNGFIRTEIKNNDNVVFLLNNTMFIEQTFQYWIKKIEGMSCCADKSRTILRRLYNYFLTGEKIVFDLSEEYTFHYPKKVFNTHKQIINVFDSLHALHYGNPMLYLKEVTDLCYLLTIDADANIDAKE
jgi:hypothetical protein